ncbi:hypothetical protein [Sphingomonas kyeonggiensis]|uniref:TonB C-terminal domain-containing protein n=1 Tax=Sphingomonas kyeonggiensis TaxID=1268553 RepID=A0A7W6NWB9_9SPHN|nr:hypothetical protein [Sphingomonas kyeonggiensis]MBB4098422.1 hypothetical protein [Sphingomonas kyeonggiensis]
MRTCIWATAGMALIASAPAWAQENSTQDGNTTIIVTGNPLSETAKRLRACLERHCPPNEDIDASLAHAENQFLEGDYRNARATLAASHGRNAQYAKQYPIEVSDLDRAYGRLTNMNGRPDDGRILQIGALDTLKGGFEAGDARILDQRLMTGDEFIHTGRITAATDVYRKVEKQAREAGHLRVMANAMLRPATLFTALSAIDSGYRTPARAAISRLERTTEPELAAFRVAAQLLRARLAATTGDDDDLEKTLQKLAGEGFTYPVLVYEEPSFRNGPFTGVAARGLDTNPEWIDLRFKIDASGRVHDVDELRRSPQISNDWPKYIFRTLPKRRYVPLKLPAGSDGMVRVERFTLVFDAQSNTGSNMQTRSTKGRLVSLDLTPDPVPSKGG